MGQDIANITTGLMQPKEIKISIKGIVRYCN